MTKKPRRPQRASFIAAEIAAALMKRHSTCYQLADQLGLGKSNALTAKRYVEQYHAAGCVRIVGVSQWGAPVYGWQSSLFAEPDCFDRVTTIKRNDRRSEGNG